LQRIGLIHVSKLLIFTCPFMVSKTCGQKSSMVTALFMHEDGALGRVPYNGISTFIPQFVDIFL